jgi:hypothetical protein
MSAGSSLATSCRMITLRTLAKSVCASLDAVLASGALGEQLVDAYGRGVVTGPDLGDQALPDGVQRPKHGVDGA